MRVSLAGARSRYKIITRDLPTPSHSVSGFDFARLSVLSMYGVHAARWLDWGCDRKRRSISLYGVRSTVYYSVARSSSSMRWSILGQFWTLCPEYVLLLRTTSSYSSPYGYRLYSVTPDMEIFPAVITTHTAPIRASIGSFDASSITNKQLVRDRHHYGLPALYSTVYGVWSPAFYTAAWTWDNNHTHLLRSNYGGLLLKPPTSHKGNSCLAIDSRKVKKIFTLLHIFPYLPHCDQPDDYDDRCSFCWVWCLHACILGFYF